MVPFKYVILYSKLNDFWAFILMLRSELCVCVCVCVCVLCMMALRRGNKRNKCYLSKVFIIRTILNFP